MKSLGVYYIIFKATTKKQRCSQKVKKKKREREREEKKIYYKILNSKVDSSGKRGSRGDSDIKRKNKIKWYTKSDHVNDYQIGF